MVKLARHIFCYKSYRSLVTEKFHYQQDLLKNVGKFIIAKDTNEQLVRKWKNSLSRNTSKIFSAKTTSNMSTYKDKTSYLSRASS